MHLRVRVHQIHASRFHLELFQTWDFIGDAPIDALVRLDPYHKFVPTGASQLRNLTRGFSEDNSNLNLLFLEGLARGQDERDAGPARPASREGVGARAGAVAASTANELDAVAA